MTNETVEKITRMIYYNGGIWKSECEELANKIYEQ